MAACSVCAARAEPEYRAAETAVGPLEVCGPHVPDALNLLGYRTDAEVASITAQVVDWLERINPVQLEQEALNRMPHLEHGEGMTGRSFLAALIDGAKAAEVGT